jgi:hypothetical protein
MDDLVERPDLAGEKADELAEMAFRGRQAVLFVMLKPAGGAAAGLRHISAYFQDHVFPPRLALGKSLPRGLRQGQASPLREG